MHYLEPTNHQFILFQYYLFYDILLYIYIINKYMFEKIDAKSKNC